MGDAERTWRTVLEVTVGVQRSAGAPMWQRMMSVGVAEQSRDPPMGIVLLH